VFAHPSFLLSSVSCVFFEKSSLFNTSPFLYLSPIPSTRRVLSPLTFYFRRAGRTQRKLRSWSREGQLTWFMRVTLLSTVLREFYSIVDSDRQDLEKMRISKNALVVLSNFLQNAVLDNPFLANARICLFPFIEHIKICVHWKISISVFYTLIE